MGKGVIPNFKIAKSFKDWANSLTTVQYVNYHLQPSDYTDKEVRYIAGRRCYMLDFAKENLGKMFNCPDGQIKELTGIFVSDDGWFWELTTAQGYHHYYPEDDFHSLVLSGFQKINGEPLERDKSVLIKTKDHQAYTFKGKFVEEDESFFFKADSGICTPLQDIYCYMYEPEKDPNEDKHESVSSPNLKRHQLDPMDLMLDPLNLDSGTVCGAVMSTPILFC